MGHAGFQLKHVYPADLGRLWTALGRPEYVERKYAALGSTNLRILQFDVDEQLIDVVLERRIRTPDSALPAWAKRIFSGSHVLHHHSRWTRVDAKSAGVELEIWPLRAPVRAHGDGAAVELSGTCTQVELRIAVQCGVPVIGTKVAQVFAEQMKQALVQDHRFTVRYLEPPTRSGRRDFTPAA